MDRRAHTDWVLVGLLFCVGLMAATQFVKVSLTLEQLSAHYARPVEAIAFFVSMVSLVGILFGVVAGAVVARLGTRPVILGALLLGAAMACLGAALPPFWPMIALRALEGVSHLALVVAVPPTMAAAATPSDRPVVMSIWAMFFGVALACAALVFPTILSWGGVPVLFVAHGIGLLILAGLLWARLLKTRGEPAQIAFLKAHIEGYRSASLAGPGLVFVIYTLLFLASLTFLPGQLERPALAGILPLISLAGTLAAGWLCKTHPPSRIMALGYLCLLFGALPLPFGLWWASYLLFIGMGLVPGACFAAIPAWNARPGDQARATGVIAQMGNIGTGLGTPLFAFAIAGAGSFGLWALMIGFPVLALGILAWVTRRLA